MHLLLDVQTQLTASSSVANGHTAVREGKFILLLGIGLRHKSTDQGLKDLHNLCLQMRPPSSDILDQCSTDATLPTGTVEGWVYIDDSICPVYMAMSRRVMPFSACHRTLFWRTGDSLLSLGRIWRSSLQFQYCTVSISGAL